MYWVIAILTLLPVFGQESAYDRLGQPGAYESLGREMTLPVLPVDEPETTKTEQDLIAIPSTPTSTKTPRIAFERAGQQQALAALVGKWLFTEKTCFTTYHVLLTITSTGGLTLMGPDSTLWWPSTTVETSPGSGWKAYLPTDGVSEATDLILKFKDPLEKIHLTGIFHRLEGSEGLSDRKSESDHEFDFVKQADSYVMPKNKNLCPIKATHEAHVKKEPNPTIPCGAGRADDGKTAAH